MVTDRPTKSPHPLRVDVSLGDEVRAHPAMSYCPETRTFQRDSRHFHVNPALPRWLPWRPGGRGSREPRAPAPADGPGLARGAPNDSRQRHVALCACGTGIPAHAHRVSGDCAIAMRLHLRWPRAPHAPRRRHLRREFRPAIRRAAKGHRCSRESLRCPLATLGLFLSDPER